MRSFIAAAASAAALSGCGIFGGDTSATDYKTASTLPPLEVPPDLTSPQRDNRYVVPESARSSATLSGYQAERREKPRAGSPLAVLPEVENLRIERAGAERWLVIPEPPEKIWPLVKEFWIERGFLIKLEVPEAGVMETDWAESRAMLDEGGVRSLLGRFLDQFYSTSERDKFRTRLERTPDGKGTEVYISHRGMEELYTTREPTSTTAGQTAWQPRPSDPQLEAEFLRLLMARLGVQDEKAKQMLAASQAQDRAEIVKRNDGSEALQVNEPFDRAWRRVGLALDRVGFTVEDRDRQKGVYFVRYADPEAEMKEKDKGLIARMFSWGDSKVKPEQYRVQITSEAQASQVLVLNKEGAAEASKTAQRILSLLHEQLK
jgi:outer membrane protein assembly factor BamC